MKDLTLEIDSLIKAFEEQKHPRGAKGTHEGGKFVKKNEVSNFVHGSHQSVIDYVEKKHDLDKKYKDADEIYRNHLNIDVNNSAKKVHEAILSGDKKLLKKRKKEFDKILAHNSMLEKEKKRTFDDFMNHLKTKPKTKMAELKDAMEAVFFAKQTERKYGADPERIGKLEHKVSKLQKEISDERHKAMKQNKKYYTDV